MVIGPVHLCAISTPLRAYSPAAIELIVHIAISLQHSFTLESSESCDGKVPCPRTQTMSQC